MTADPSATHTDLVPFVDLVAQYESIADDIDDAFHSVTRSAQYILGARVEAFEAEFAAFVEAEHAVGVGSGLDALRLGLLALGIGPGDEVIVPANSYIATALAVSETGADVVLVDCDAETYNIDASSTRAAVTPRTRAIIPVHFTGQAADMAPLLELAEELGLDVVEDAAQAHGTRWRNRACGSIGKVGCFSFYPGKNLGALGDGGLVTTSDADIAERLRRVRNYGERRKYEHVVKGVNSRLDGMQAAFLSVKLPHLDTWNAARARHAAAYQSALQGIGDVRFQEVISDSTHIYHLFVVRTSQRDALRKFLDAHGIQTGIHYPVPIHLQDAYIELGLPVGSFPNAEALASETLSLPMYPELSHEDLHRVTSAIVDFFGRS